MSLTLTESVEEGEEFFSKCHLMFWQAIVPQGSRRLSVAPFPAGFDSAAFEVGGTIVVNPLPCSASTN
jgi:hypothetical protein